MPTAVSAQPIQKENVKIVRSASKNKIDIYCGGEIFTSFLFRDTTEKPILFPVRAANGTTFTRGFPIATRAGEPTDHPHHSGVWFTFENVNGLDFWNNSYAIAPENKDKYGWIKTDSVTFESGDSVGNLAYHANWTNQQNDVLLEENTKLIFTCAPGQRIIDRITILKARIPVTFNDAKDGMYGIRLAHELQIPSKEDEKYSDNNGNMTIVKKGQDSIASGNYITSEGKAGDDAWSSRGRWCKVFAKMGNDSVSVTIIDHPANVNYPTFWHARGYGLFAANPLGEKVFTNGTSYTNLSLKPGESVTFRFRMVIDNGTKTISPAALNQLADEFAQMK